MFDRYVAFAARQMPDGIAASTGREHVSYRDLDRAVDGVATLLDRALDGRGGERDVAVVGIAVRDAYRHALIALACARLGVASASLFPHAASAMAAIAGVTLLVSDVGAADALVADGTFFANAAAASAARHPRRAIDPHAIGRVQFSSGSTGTPKAVEIAWAAYDVRIGGGLFGGGDGMRRVLSLIAPESGALQLMATTWKHRGCVLFGPDTPAALAAALPVLAPSGMLASPSQLAALLDALPATFAPALGLDVAVGGGRLSASLADRAARRLGARLTTVYASTEAGTTAIGYAAALAGQGAAGYVTASTAVEIVDATGEPVGDGVVGRVRIASSEMARGYRGGTNTGSGIGTDAAEEDGAFVDGWFLPGDLGAIEADGTLRIVGRIDEVMNLGGEKFLPDMLEEPVRGVPGVVDVAAFALDDAEGRSQPWLAIVRDGEVEESAVGAAIRIPNLPPVRIVWADTIPRTMMGKVRRQALQDAVRGLPVA